jgi:hypothetical protein
MDVDSDYSPAASPLPKATAAPLGNATNKGKGRAVEDQYKKLSQLEHILLRPDT